MLAEEVRVPQRCPVCAALALSSGLPRLKLEPLLGELIPEGVLEQWRASQSLRLLFDVFILLTLCHSAYVVLMELC